MKTVQNILDVFFLLIIAACSVPENIDPIEEEVPIEENPPIYMWPVGPKYYYGFDTKIYLYEVPNKIVVSFNKKHLLEAEQYLQENGRILEMEMTLYAEESNVCVLTTAEDSDTGVLIKDLKKQAWAKSVYPVYVLDDGYGHLELCVTDEISVLFKDHASQQEIAEIHEKYSVIVKDHPYPDLFPKLHQVLSVPIYVDILGVANAYQESGLVVYSYPNFISKKFLDF